MINFKGGYVSGYSFLWLQIYLGNKNCSVMKTYSPSFVLTGSIMELVFDPNGPDILYLELTYIKREAGGSRFFQNSSQAIYNFDYYNLN